MEYHCIELEKNLYKYIEEDEYGNRAVIENSEYGYLDSKIRDYEVSRKNKIEKIENEEIPFWKIK